MIFMGKSMVSGFDFPSHQSIDSSYFLGVLNMGFPIAGWFLSGKIPSTNG